MTLFATVLMLLVTFASALLLTFLVRRYALARSILDLPNERSLHTVPIPRGGGLAIAATFVLGVVVLGFLAIIPVNVATALSGGGLLVALIGWIDDGHGLRPVVRVAAHTTAAVWALVWLGGVNQVQLGGYTLDFGVAGTVAAVLGIVWWINLYNFMDGIDGIAAGQALTVGAGAALLIALTRADAIGSLPILLAAAAAGFLIFNWEPARVFMGDTGSGFLGFAFAALAIASERAGTLPIVYWVLLSGVFIFDSTVTLIRRVIQREPWYAAHRNHAYQRLVALGYSHARVAGGVLAANAIIFVIVALAATGRVHIGIAAATEIVGLTAAYLLVESAFPMASRRATGAGVGASHG